MQQWQYPLPQGLQQGPQQSQGIQIVESAVVTGDSSYEMRVMALECAIKAADTGHQVIGLAEEFYKFLRGER